MKKRILPLLLALLLTLSACGEETHSPSGSPVPIPTPTSTEEAGPAEFVLPCYDAESFHPLTSSNRTNLGLAGLIYEGLFEVDETFAPKGVLCTAQSVREDGLVWTFTLRNGVTFSDGSALTAGDVVSSLQTARSAASLYAARLGHVQGVEAVDSSTVVVTLNAPNGTLPALLDFPIVKEAPAGPLGTGPFRLVAEDGTLSLHATPGWWQGKALPVAEIRLYSVRAADSLIHAFDTREISLVSADLTGANVLGFSGSYEVWDYPTSIMLYVGYNAAAGVCADPAVRKALSYGFDRSAVAKSLLSGHATAAALPVSPASASYDAALSDTLDYSPQAVDAQLTAAGWTLQNGERQKGQEPLTLTLIVNTDNTYKIAIADYLAGDLAKSGVRVAVKKLTWEEYNTALAQGNFDLYLGQVKLTADFDLSALLQGGGSLNYGGYADADTSTLLSGFLAANDITRPAAASDLARRISEQAPFTVLCFKHWSILTHWGKLSGVTATQPNVFYHFWDWITR